ncbi:MAG: hypothetical protein ABW221_10595 [Vicinamibacteria bacterium]
MRRTAWAVILVSSIFGAAEARAAVWAVNAAGCTSPEGIRYTAGAGSTSYRSTQSTGPITLFCPIAAAVPACPSAYRLRLTFADPDGPGSSVSVTAQLMRQAQKDGSAVGAVPGAIVTSNHSPLTVPTNETSVDFSHDFSVFADDYFVRVDMNRLLAGSLVSSFYGVALECTE